MKGQIILVLYAAYYIIQRLKLGVPLSECSAILAHSLPTFFMFKQTVHLVHSGTNNYDELCSPGILWTPSRRVMKDLC